MAGFGAALGLIGKGGRAKADGTMVGSPPTWKCKHEALGTYKVTHNLNRDPNTYIVLACGATSPVGERAPTPPPALFVFVDEQKPDYFTICITSGPPSAPGIFVDAPFNFLVCLT